MNEVREAVPGVRQQVTANINTSRRSLRLGFFVKGTPSWFIFVGNLGSVNWIAGDEDVVRRTEVDPPWRRMGTQEQLGELLLDEEQWMWWSSRDAECPRRIGSVTNGVFEAWVGL